MKKSIIITGLLLMLLGTTVFLTLQVGAFTTEYKTASDFHIETVHSASDYNHDGVDDYTDMMLGARKDAENMPMYDGSYVTGGLPADDRGACTDLVWRAFKNAGYSLKDMVNTDIANHVSEYPRVHGNPDSNIDFRRVPNLQVFFNRYALSLTTNTAQIAEWQPGDIVTYGNYHIGIVSDKRDANGVPYLIHNEGQSRREQDTLCVSDISGHYRFDASQIDSQVLIPWQNK